MHHSSHSPSHAKEQHGDAVMRNAGLSFPGLLWQELTGLNVREGNKCAGILLWDTTSPRHLDRMRSLTIRTSGIDIHLTTHAFTLHCGPAQMMCDMQVLTMWSKGTDMVQADTPAFALHLWTRVQPLVSVRRIASIGACKPWETVALACLWLAAKHEEARRALPPASRCSFAYISPGHCSTLRASGTTHEWLWHMVCKRQLHGSPLCQSALHHMANAPVRG